MKSVGLCPRRFKSCHCRNLSVAQLVERQTVEVNSDLLVAGSIPVAEKKLISFFCQLKCKKVDKKMVCLFTTAINATAEKNLTDEYWEDHTPFNWLIYDLAGFVYSKSSETKPAPHIPTDKNTLWGVWFTKVLTTLKKEFYDADEERTIRVLENCPAEDVAIMIFETLEIPMIIEYIATCPHGAG